MRGANKLIFTPAGMVVDSEDPAILPGNTVFDYTDITVPQWEALILRVTHEGNPIEHKYSVLKNGKYTKKKADVYYTFDGFFTAISKEIEVRNNIMRLSEYQGPSQNQFTVSPTTGKILHCTYPHKTIQKKIIGKTAFDGMFPEFIKPIQRIMNICVEKQIILPCSYGFCIGGQTRYKTGVIRPAIDLENVIFDVHRVYRPEQHQKAAMGGGVNK